MPDGAPLTKRGLAAALTAHSAVRKRDLAAAARDITRRLDSIDRRLNTLDRRLDGVANDVHLLDRKIAEFDQSLTLRIVALDAKIAELERRPDRAG